jgi:hypothetical protein
LHSHAGSIVSVLNIEFEGSSLYKNVGIYPIGVNGRLANADLVTTAFSSFSYSNIPVVIQDGVKPFVGNINSWDGFQKSYFSYLTNLLKFIRVQALGFSNYDHSLFALYNIEAISLIGHVETDNGQVSMIDVGMYENYVYARLIFLFSSLAPSRPFFAA